MTQFTLIVCIAVMILASAIHAERMKVAPPEVFFHGHDEHSTIRHSNPTMLPDGRLIRYSLDGKTNELTSHTSEDGGRSWKKMKFECKVLPGTYMVMPLLDRDGEVHLVSMVGRGKGKVAVTYFIDVWHQRTTNKRTKWEEPNVIYNGYCGALMDFKQLSTGRLITPFAWWVPNRPVAPPIGANLCTAFYSDDGGYTWSKSESDLSSPCYPGFVGNNYGADEPSIIELKDGRLWMLMRTQTGFLYESFSGDQGETWSAARPSRFMSSSSPPVLWRMPDDRIMLLWNNCESPPRHEGAGIYVNRDALHAAISDDEGKTWRGFREVYRDPLENETPPSTDHGSAYPTPPVMVKGKVLFLTGQGKGRRNLISLDPRWITLTHHKDDFSNGLKGWIAFKSIGPAKRWMRSRIPGPELIAHPSKAGAKVLHLRSPDENEPDGALWNFPNGVKGALTLRLMLNPGFAGGGITLNDRSFKPTDNNSERLAIFTVSISADGRIGTGPKLDVGKWHTLNFVWDLPRSSCDIMLDGQQALTLGQLNLTGNGVSYLHLRSRPVLERSEGAETIDKAGFMIESVSVDIADPVAPERTPEENQALLDRYRPSYYTAPHEREEAAKKALKLFR